MPDKQLNFKLSLPYRAEDYLYNVCWSEEDQVYIGRVAEFPSLAAHSDTQTKALQEITDVVHFVLEDLVESDGAVPEPFSKRRYSGKLNLRMPEFMHRTLTIEAAQHGISLNQWIMLKLGLTSTSMMHPMH